METRWLYHGMSRQQILAYNLGRTEKYRTYNLMYHVEIKQPEGENLKFKDFDSFLKYFLQNDVDMNDLVQRHIHGYLKPLEPRLKMFFVELMEEA